MEASPLNILIVEDNLSHLNLTKYALESNNIRGNIFTVRDGQEALDYLFRRAAYADSSRYPLPDLILLDLNLPKRDGREVLDIVKQHETLKRIPIIIVSTSDREEDVRFAMEKGVVAYISKSMGFEKFNESLAEILKLLPQG